MLKNHNLFHKATLTQGQESHPLPPARPKSSRNSGGSIRRRFIVASRRRRVTANLLAQPFRLGSKRYYRELLSWLKPEMALSSHSGGFASMDLDKQVHKSTITWSRHSRRHPPPDIAPNRVSLPRAAGLRPAASNPAASLPCDNAWLTPPPHHQPSHPHSSMGRVSPWTLCACPLPG